MLDFNDAAPQRESGDLIPNGTVVRVIGTIRPGMAGRPGQNDGGWLTASKSSDSLYLNWEFTVIDGPYARRKFWQNMTVHGGEVNEGGESKAWNITKSTIKAILNSAHALRPDDGGEAALTKRRIASWEQLNGLEFVCKVRVAQPKPGSTFQAQNQIAQVIEPGNKDYVQSGVVVPAASPVAAPVAAWANGNKAATPAAGALPAWAR